MAWFLAGFVVAGAWFFVRDVRDGDYFAAAIDGAVTAFCSAAILIG